MATDVDYKDDDADADEDDDCYHAEDESVSQSAGQSVGLSISRSVSQAAGHQSVHPSVRPSVRSFRPLRFLGFLDSLDCLTQWAEISGIVGEFGLFDTRIFFTTQPMQRCYESLIRREQAVQHLQYHSQRLPRRSSWRNCERKVGEGITSEANIVY